MFRSFFRGRIFTYYFIVFIGFTTLIVLFQYKREKQFRQGQFETILDNITSTTNRYLDSQDFNDSILYESIDSLIKILPLDDVRISIISFDGTVLYDSFVEFYSGMENHSNRPEIINAITKGSGSSLRHSATTGKDYFYYAKVYDNIIIRAAAEYNYELESFLRIDKLFIIVILILFLLVWTALGYVNYRFKKATLQLKELVSNVTEDRDISHLDFPANELGSLGNQVMGIYNELKQQRDKLETDQEKILRHLQTMEEGIAIFSSDRQLIFSNESFVQNANLLASKPINSPKDALGIKALKPVIKFVNRVTADMTLKVFDHDNFKEIIAEKQNRYFLVRCNMFRDLSFEIIIKNVTKSQKSKLLKQQLTSNIAHELRTPVTSVMGFLETVLGNPELSDSRRNHFLERARVQVDRLAELIDHISVINKLEEGSDFYRIDSIIVVDIINEVIESLTVKLEEKEIRVSYDIDRDLTISGNKVLIHSIFQNLLENTLFYAGENIDVLISRYYEDDNMHYFRFTNTGNSIPEEHLNRLFERFYRVDEGRTRLRGGSGLGLAIVKHAVHFHKGQISVKNLESGGVEFQFTLSKSL
jgi:signal transduction histidine kinase